MCVLCLLCRSSPVQCFSPPAVLSTPRAVLPFLRCAAHPLCCGCCAAYPVLCLLCCQEVVHQDLLLRADSDDEDREEGEGEEDHMTRHMSMGY